MSAQRKESRRNRQYTFALCSRNWRNRDPHQPGRCEVDTQYGVAHKYCSGPSGALRASAVDTSERGTWSFRTTKAPNALRVKTRPHRGLPVTEEDAAGDDPVKNGQCLLRRRVFLPWLLSSSAWKYRMHTSRVCSLLSPHNVSYTVLRLEYPQIGSFLFLFPSFSPLRKAGDKGTTWHTSRQA